MSGGERQFRRGDKLQQKHISEDESRTRVKRNTYLQKKTFQLNGR